MTYSLTDIGGVDGMYVQCMFKCFNFIVLFHTILLGPKKNNIFFKRSLTVAVMKMPCYTSLLKTRPSVCACQNSAFLNTSFVLGTLWITLISVPRESFNEVIVFFSVIDK